jgi:Icc-related predicted phosphoesterase
MRISFVSDLHCRWEVRVKECDLLICCGDMTNIGGDKELARFNQWIGEQPANKKIYISGNHDLMFKKNCNFAKSLITNAEYLEDSLIEIEGLKIYGSPWIPIINWSWAFEANSERLKERWKKIPEGVDILVTHSPPYEIMDACYRGRRFGCANLRREVLSRIKPKIHVFGHIHQWESARRIEYIVGTYFINASICDDFLNPVIDPILISYDKEANIFEVIEES